MTAIPIGDTGHESAAAEPSLKRVMGPWLLLLFIIGDVLGTGIYALTGQVAKQVGGAVWLPFVVAFLVGRPDHRLQLPGAGDEISAGRRRRALHPQGLRPALRDLPGSLRGDVLRPHLRVHRGARLLGQHGARLRSGARWRLRHHPGRPRLHGRGCRHQLPRRRREPEDERRADVRGAGGPADHHLHRPDGHRRRPGRRVACPGAQDAGRRQRLVLAGDCRHNARLLRHGGLRGLGQHGRGVQGPDPHVPQGAAGRAPHHRAHLRAGVDLRHHPGAAATSSARARRRCSRWWRPAHPGSRWASSPSSPCSRSPTPPSSTC